MIWFTYVQGNTEKGFYLESYEYDYDDMALSDIDEPQVSAGRTFPTVSEAIDFASTHGIRLMTGTPPHLRE